MPSCSHARALRHTSAPRSISRRTRRQPALPSCSRRSSTLCSKETSAMRTSLLALAAAACGNHHPLAVPPPGADAGPSVAPIVCTGKATPPADDVWSITSGGIPRLVNVHVPAHYDPTVPTPLVLNFHGFTSHALHEAALSQMTP